MSCSTSRTCQSSSFIIDASCRLQHEYWQVPAVPGDLAAHQAQYRHRKARERLPCRAETASTIMHYDGKTTIGLPFSERRKLLEAAVSPTKQRIMLAKQIMTDDEGCRREVSTRTPLAPRAMRGSCPEADAVYKPGSRVGFGVKVKPVMETLDWSSSARTGGKARGPIWLTSLHPRLQAGRRTCRNRQGLRRRQDADGDEHELP